MLSFCLSRWLFLLSLILAFKCYEAAEISAPNQIFYFLPELYVIVCLMLVVPTEITVFGVISLGWVGPHLGRPSQELFVLYLAQDL